MKSIAERFSPILRIVVTSAVFATTTAGNAQEEDRTIVALREDFLRQIESASAPVTDLYITSLKKMESERAAVRDYETALAVNRRLQWLEMTQSTGSDEAGSITLLPGSARTSGRISREGGVGADADILASWRTVGSSATWDVHSIVPGNYLLRVEYSCGESEEKPDPRNPALETIQAAGGSFYFEEVTNLAGAEESRLSFNVRSTGGWEKYETVDLGEISIGRTSGTYRIVASRVEPLGLMNLRKVSLVPASEANDKNPAGTKAAGEPARLTRLREDHLSRLSAKRSPIAEVYVAKLNALVDAVPGVDLEEAKKLVKVESENAWREAKAPLVFAEKSEVSGEDERVKTLRDVRWMADPGNRGDRFMVKVDGDTFPVKSLFVTCPIPVEGDGRSAEYFGITRKEAGYVGKEAADFTAKYLEGRPLTLFFSGKKDAEGNLIAVISLRGIGVYGRVLVSRGLAMIDPSGKAIHGEMTSSDYVKDALVQSEARARDDNRGAWTFSQLEGRRPGSTKAPPAPATPTPQP